MFDTLALLIEVFLVLVIAFIGIVFIIFTLAIHRAIKHVSNKYDKSSK